MTELIKRRSIAGRFFFFGRAYPLQRPRRAKQGGVYQDLSDQQEMIYQLKQHEPLSLEIPIILDTLIFFKRPTKLNIPYPTQNKFGDIDNIQKAIADNLQKAGHIVDDRLIVGGQSYKLFADEDWVSITIYIPEIVNYGIPTSQKSSEGGFIGTDDGS